MQENSFYMISEDCFERKEFLGCINDYEIKYLISRLKENPIFTCEYFCKDLEKSLKEGERFLQSVQVEEELIKKYQNLISYTKGAELFLTAFTLEEKKDHPNLELEKEYWDSFLRSSEQYQRIYASAIEV